MRRGLPGRYEVTVVAGERIQAFIPDPLPPNPPLELNVQRVVRKITGRRRNRVSVYHDYLNILSEGTEAI